MLDLMVKGDASAMKALIADYAREARVDMGFKHFRLDARRHGGSLPQRDGSRLRPDLRQRCGCGGDSRERRGGKRLRRRGSGVGGAGPSGRQARQRAGRGTAQGAGGGRSSVGSPIASRHVVPPAGPLGDAACGASSRLRCAGSPQGGPVPLSIARSARRRRSTSNTMSRAACPISTATWISSSPTVRAFARELGPRLDVSFGPTTAETLDIYPAARPDAPVSHVHSRWLLALAEQQGVQLRGGGSGRSRRDRCDQQLRTLPGGHRHGDRAAEPRRTSPGSTENAAAFGGNRNRIYVSGHSAGGHLTAMLLATDWERDFGLPFDLVKGGTAISGLFDLEPFVSLMVAAQTSLER